MREQIERVIAELEKRKEEDEKMATRHFHEGDKYHEGVNSGRAMAYQAAVHQLKVVLSEHES